MLPGEDNLSSGLHPFRLPLAGPVDGVILLVGAGVKSAPGDLPALRQLSGDRHWVVFRLCNYISFIS